MRKILFVVLATLSVGLLGAAYSFYSKYRTSEANFAQSKAEEERTWDRYSRAITEIAMIQDSLNAIVLGEEDARQLVPSDLQTELHASGTRGEEVVARIGVLKAGIERTKARIQELDDNLKRSGVRIEGLERMVARLRHTVAEKEQLVATLVTQVDTLETRVAGLTHELGTIYYAMGTKRELLGSGLVEAKGGVLGIGKTLKPSGHVDEMALTPLDTDRERVIRIPADEAQVLSAQPATSYMLQPVAENLVELHIIDPREFRKVKHLVIMTS